MGYIKKWCGNQKAKMIRQRSQAIQDEFKITEKDGKIWLTHLGIALKEFPNNTKAQDIAKELNSVRKSAIEYEGYSTALLSPETQINDVEIEVTA